MGAELQLGRYRIVRRIAAGGMAEVFLAQSEGPAGFKKNVVLKRVLPHLADDPSFVEMLMNEAKLAAQLNHPQIVQIFELGCDDGQWFIAMEYIEGLSLRGIQKRLRKLDRPMPVELAAQVVADACLALGYAHRLKDATTGEPMQLVHRDISPENLLLSSQGAVKVVDFGIARAANLPHLTRTGMVKGKMAYMAPEQIRAEPLDGRADVYALGVTLYELVAGRPPFDAPHEAALIHCVLNEQIRTGPAIRADVPDSLWRCIERAMAKPLSDRYPDCESMATDLGRVVMELGKPAGAAQLAALVRELESVDVSQPNLPSPISKGFVVPPRADADAPTAVESGRTPSREAPTRAGGPSFAVVLEGQPENLLLRLVARYGETELSAKPDALDSTVPTGGGGARLVRMPEHEKHAFEALEQRGFTWKPLLGRFNATGDLALRTWLEPAAVIPSSWEIRLPKTSRLSASTEALRSSVTAEEGEGGSFNVQVSFRAGGDAVAFTEVLGAIRAGREYVRVGERRYARIGLVGKLSKSLDALALESGSQSVPAAKRGALIELAEAADEKSVPVSLSGATGL